MIFYEIVNNILGLLRNYKIIEEKMCGLSLYDQSQI
jgi:hypothetical protein